MVKIERFQDFEHGDNDGRYLFFGNELHIGQDRKEDHRSILQGSQRRREDVAVAGGYSI